MCKRICFLSLVLLFACVPVFGGVGIFNYTGDIGAVGGYGVTTTVAGSNRYEIIAGGSDIWGTADEFHFAYNVVSGNVRFEMTPMWEVAPDYWAKIEAMIRVNTSPGSIAYATATRRQDENTRVVPPVQPGPWVGAQIRSVENAGMWGGTEWGGTKPSKIGIQRVVSGGFQLVQALVDFGAGAGWQNLDTRIVPGLPDQLLLGAAVTSHNNNALGRAVIVDPAYTQNPDLVGITTVRDPDGTCPQSPGFKIRSIKVGMGLAWPGSPAGAGYAAMNTLLDSGQYPAGVDGEEEGTRVDRFVNLYDSGGRGEFYADNGYPDVTFPGIDDWESPASDPAGGPPNGQDDDDNFATEVIACIQLTAGLHIIGANSDDGTIIWIGGVEIGRAGEWKGASNADFLFSVATAGLYSFKARMLEGGGGASLELHEILPDGTRILLGDTARGGSPVYVPEPATIALLGLGGLSLLGSRRKH
jgi:hypothetical protein